MSRRWRKGALRIALVLVLASGVPRGAIAFGDKLSWGAPFVDHDGGLGPSQPMPAAAATGSSSDGGDTTAAADGSGPGATCWARDCSAAFAERACETVGSMSVECDALIDAGVAYATREACCAKTFGPAGCGTGCFVPKEGARGEGVGGGGGGGGGGSSTDDSSGSSDADSSPNSPSSSSTTSNPNRECALLSGPARCAARRRARLPVYGAEPECCAAVYGGPCMRFPDRCYAADPDWPGQCRAVEGAGECAALYWAAREKALASGIVIGNGAGLAGNGGGGGGGASGAAAAGASDDGTGDVGFSLTREACCRANGFERAFCAQTVECYEPDYRALPTRRCTVTESSRCLERMAAGSAYSTRGECCATAFGPGRGCREFPDACYRFDPREFTADGSPMRPFDACPRVEGASVGTCALLLEQDSAAAQAAAEAEAEAAAAATVARRSKKDGAAGAPARPAAGGEEGVALAPLTTPRVFEQRVDCCSAALPLGWVDFDSPDLARGCPYAPSSCWAPVRARARARPVPGGGRGAGADIYCAPLKDRPADCARRVSGGTAWVTRDECCRRVGGCASARRAAGAGGGGGGKARTTRVTRGPATPRAPGTAAVSPEAALATNPWGAGAGGGGMDAVGGSFEAAAAGGGSGNSGDGGGGGSSSSGGGGDDDDGLALRRRADDDGLGDLGSGGGGGSSKPPGLVGLAAARDQATGAAASATSTTRAAGARGGAEAGGASATTAAAAVPARPTAVAAAPPRRPRTTRDIATEPVDAAPWVVLERQAAAREAAASAARGGAGGEGRDWEEPEERPAPVAARATAAPAALRPEAKAAEPPSPSEAARAILPDPSSYWGFGTDEEQPPEQQQQPEQQEEQAPSAAARRERLQQQQEQQRTWPATPIEEAPAPPAAPPGPPPVAATPFAAPSYFASGKRRRRRRA